MIFLQEDVDDGGDGGDGGDKEETLMLLPERKPSLVLPSLGGEHYEDGNISIDYHPAGSHEHYFISPKEIIGFPVLPRPTKIVTAFDSDRLTHELWMPNSMGCTQAGSEVYAKNCEKSSMARLLVVNYNPALREEIEEQMPNRRALFRSDHNLIPSPTLKLLRQSILKFVLSDGSGGRLIAESFTTLLIAETLKMLDKHSGGAAKSASKLDKHLLARVLEFVEEGLERDIGLQEMGDCVSLSQYHFLKCFKESMGVTPHAYLTERRIEKAKELLAGTKNPVVEVAAMCGFSSSSHLSSVFKRYVGMTPKEFRKLSSD